MMCCVISIVLDGWGGDRLAPPVPKVGDMALPREEHTTDCPVLHGQP